MRDIERIKPKYSVTLDNKQVVMIVVSFIVILVLVFAIGFVLGRSMGTREVQQANLMPQQIRPRNAVVFTQQTAEVPGRASGEGYGRPEQAETQTAETRTTTAVQSPTTTAGRHSELTFYTSLTKNGRREKGAQKKQAERTAPKKSARRQEGKFSIQCGAFQQKSGADRQASDLKKRYRLATWIARATTRGGRLYEVRIGHFESRKRAQIYEQGELIRRGVRNCVIAVDK
ncbi:MAG: SPOR domain-containing protein [Deltaproteobacteria bacterium]|nr:SPOR domain-containing protein [Deltaproteobacteria bacterium]MCL5276956.1 SPOR domain-containing protein [Deltaproteobacteria bacterium]